MEKDTKGGKRLDKRKIIERKSLAHDAYNEIRERIYSNEIKPGDLIKESNIAEELGISRTPVREAIKMLVSEDILEVRDGVGTFVKVLSFKDIKDIYEVRKLLEVLAAKSSIYRIPIEIINGLEDHFKAYMKECEKGNLNGDRFSDIDLEVHKLIVDYCDNEYAKNIYTGMKLKIKQSQHISYENLNNTMESITQHLEILRLIKEKDLVKLIKFIEEHIDWSLRCLL